MDDTNKKDKKQKLVVEEVVDDNPEEDSFVQDSPASSVSEENDEIHEPIEEKQDDNEESQKSETLIPPIPPQPLSDQKKNKKTLLLIIGLIVVALGIGGGVMFFKGESVIEPTTEEPTEIPAPTPTPEPEFKREDLKVQVLNGTTTSGLAASAKEYLEELGYKDVATGNASTKDYEKTEFSIKSEKDELTESIKKDLEKEYELADTVGELDEGSDYDVVIIIGSAE